MPIYVFKCETCGEQLEKILPLDQRDAQNPVCSACETKMERSTSQAFATTFGEGFYDTGGY